MAIRENYKIKTNDAEYILTGQSGIFKEEDYSNKGQQFLLNKDKTHRFILIDLWQLGVFGSENVKQTYDEQEELNIVTEEDIVKYTEDVVKYINDGLFDRIKESIIEEIEADEQETMKLIR